MNQKLTKFTYNIFQQLAATSSNELDEKLDELTRLGISFATNPKFRDNVNQGRWEEAALVTDVYKNISDEQFIDLIFLADAQGNIKGASPRSLDIIGKNFSYRDWYQGVSSSAQPYVSEVYRRANAPEKNVVAVAIPIIGEDQLLIGILVFQVRLDHFLDWITKISAGTNGFAYIVDQKGQIVADPEYAPQDKIINQSGVTQVQYVLAGKSGVEEVYDSKKQINVLLAYHPSRYHWGVLVQQPVARAFSERTFIRIALAIIFLFTVLVNGIFVMLLKKALKSNPANYENNTSQRPAEKNN